jgi:Uma2 family endonuclease
MNLIPPLQKPWQNGYPTSDGKPMAETDWHRILMTLLIEMLSEHFAQQRKVYVSGNLLLFYEEGNRRQHVSPDVFVVRGVEKRLRPNYLVWQEGRAPQVVIELTSSSTRREDLTTKMALYRDTLQVREYFLFDPYGDYLDPPLQGYRLRQGQYRPIRPAAGRLPSQVLGLHLERDGESVHLWNPATGGRLLSNQDLRRRAEQMVQEQAQELASTAQALADAEQHALQADLAAAQANLLLGQQRRRAEQAENEVARLRQQLEALQGPGGAP